MLLNKTFRFIRVGKSIKNRSKFFCSEIKNNPTPNTHNDQEQNLDKLIIDTIDEKINKAKEDINNKYIIDAIETKINKAKEDINDKMYWKTFLIVLLIWYFANNNSDNGHMDHKFKMLQYDIDTIKSNTKKTY